MSDNGKSDGRSYSLWCMLKRSSEGELRQKRGAMFHADGESARPLWVLILRKMAWSLGEVEMSA